ncbi:hypothetical protein JM946_09700 [Steroidobacter sp. S1-65]|uniref:Lipoprotein n=1 Tax=Steroidobacter gossypii TaxID=2805490 RepID=A0ABS1WVP0_9GAMM|nr:hypothetical protein [Steroidobacter gossypii]MBM0105024.1 hypothetical protein [Steroidobacter gossypii]
MHLEKWILMSACALGLFGCVAPVSKDARPPSEALVIARAAGFENIKDISPEVLRSLLDAEGSPLQTLHAAGLVAGVFKGAPGLPLGAEVALLLATSGPRRRLEDSPRLLVWMPREMAASPPESINVLGHVLANAVAAALPEAKVEFIHRQTEKDPPLGRRYIHHERYIRVDLPGCKDCALRTGAFANYLRPPRVQQAPEFLGAYEAYFWGTLSDGDSWLAGYPWTAEDLEPRQRREILRRLSAHLPMWVYIYVPFDEKIAPYPHILHRGRELIFVEPGFDDSPEG